MTKTMADFENIERVAELAWQIFLAFLCTIHSIVLQIHVIQQQGAKGLRRRDRDTFGRWMECGEGVLPVPLPRKFLNFSFGMACFGFMVMAQTDIDGQLFLACFLVFIVIYVLMLFTCVAPCRVI